jgi:hypothetical protein
MPIVISNNPWEQLGALTGQQRLASDWTDQAGRDQNYLQMILSENARRRAADEQTRQFESNQDVNIQKMNADQAYRYAEANKQAEQFGVTNQRVLDVAKLKDPQGVTYMQQLQLNALDEAQKTGSINGQQYLSAKLGILGGDRSPLNQTDPLTGQRYGLSTDRFAYDQLQARNLNSRRGLTAKVQGITAELKTLAGQTPTPAVREMIATKQVELNQAYAALTNWQPEAFVAPSGQGSGQVGAVTPAGGAPDPFAEDARSAGVVDPAKPFARPIPLSVLRQYLGKFNSNAEAAKNQARTDGFDPENVLRDQ